MICIPSTLADCISFVPPPPEYHGPMCERCGFRARLETLTVNGRDETWLRCLRYLSRKVTNKGRPVDRCPIIKMEATMLQNASEELKARYKALPRGKRTGLLAEKAGLQGYDICQFFGGTRRLGEEVVRRIEEGLADLESPADDLPESPTPNPAPTQQPAPADAWDLGKAIRVHLAELLALPGGRVVLRAALELAGWEA